MKTTYSFIKRIVPAFALILSSSAMAQTEVPDTLVNMENASQVVITESASGSRISVVGENQEVVASVFTPYSQASSVKSESKEVGSLCWLKNRNILEVRDNDGYWGVTVDGLCLGLTKADGQTPSGGLQWSKSFEICWMSCLNVYYNFGRSSVSLGLGFDWRNYKITTSGRCLVAEKDGGIGWGAYPDGAKGRFSRLKVFSLQLPLLYEWNIPKSSLSFKAGPIFNFNTYASLKTVWDDEDGNRRELFTKEIDSRRFTVDFFASLSLCGTVGIYARYSPMKVMDAPQTLNFRPLTVGVAFGI